MAALSEFVGRLLPEVPGCPRHTLIEAARDAVIAFCERTNILKLEHAPITTVASTASYAFVPSAGTEVHDVLQAWYDGNEIFPIDTDQIENIYTDWMNESGTPKYFTRLDKRNIRLVPNPDAAVTNGLTMLVTLKPAIDATTIDDTVYEEYRDTIEAHAKGKLMAMPGKTWTNIKLASAYIAKFEENVGMIRYKAGKGHVRTRRRNKAHFF